MDSPFWAQLLLCAPTPSSPVATLDCLWEYVICCNPGVSIHTVGSAWDPLPTSLSPKFSLYARQSSISHHLLYEAFMPTVFPLRKKELSLFCGMMVISGYCRLVCFTWGPK